MNPSLNEPAPRAAPLKTDPRERSSPTPPDDDRSSSVKPSDEPDSTVTLHVRVKPSAPKSSARTKEVAFRYGLSVEPEAITLFDGVTISAAPGRIILLLGPSGSGKTSALSAIARHVPGARWVHRVDYPPDVALVDAVQPGASLDDALRLLSRCALAEAPLWLRAFDQLSEGEKFRARLARAIGLRRTGSIQGPLLCDEFCSTLHRRAARALSFNLRKLASEQRLGLVLASVHEDLVEDLQPDCVVRLKGRGLCELHPHRPRSRPMSLRRRLVIEPGYKKDYRAFAAMHYRKSDELGFVDKVFVMRERGSDELLGIVVYSHGPLELSLRNQATDYRFSRNPKLLNRHFRILRRLVIHPDVRGCGLGRRLVRQTLPQVGTEYVECLATMGSVNPVFEKAGMKRIGQYGLTPSRVEAARRLKRLNVDIHAADFLHHVRTREEVYRIVAGVVHDWYQTTTAGGERRVERQSRELLATLFRNLIGCRPTYYLWRRRCS